MSVSHTRRVTFSQLEQLWEFLNKNRCLATGFNKTSQAREFSKRMWEEIAQYLNSHGDGATKDWKGWCKYWNDYKSKLKKNVALVRASHQLTGGGPSNVRPLTEIEEKFLLIVGQDFGTGLPGIRVQPNFEREPIEPQPVASNRILTPTIEEATQEFGQDKRNLPNEDEAQDGGSLSVLEYWGGNEPQPGPSRILTPPPAPQATEVQPPAARSPRTPRRSPRAAGSTPRRRRPRRALRRDPPVSQEAARRSLIEISSRRAEIEERNTNLLGQLVAEIREIKQILLSRNAGHPTVDE
ncbi:myb-related transcription factor, partner of profilin-like [Amyelois transitella]|uniref:myb-related transcription factor, partner of profilin-like n=1 Tax=Amyelois transitella TaxID=680683 RepID=UPI00298FB9C5|nr:myb-related transcription factor, partner of profilin-like [Amyelois transitella]